MFYTCFIDAFLPEILPIDTFMIASGDLNINMLSIANPVKYSIAMGFLR